MDLGDEFDLEHFVFTERRCRSCDKIKELTSDFYKTRKGSGPSKQIITLGSYFLKKFGCESWSEIFPTIKKLYNEFGFSINSSPYVIRNSNLIFSLRYIHSNSAARKRSG